MKPYVINCALPGFLLCALILALPACKPASTKAGIPVQSWKVEPVMRTSSSPYSVRYGESFYRLGRHEDLQGRLSAAEAYYRKAIVSDPEHADAHNALGVLLAESDRLGEAVAMLERAVILAPANASLRNNLGYAQFLAGQTDAARRRFREALLLEPGNPRARSNLQLASVPEQAIPEPAPVTAELRSEPTLVLVETAPQRFELNFAGALASSQPAELSVRVPAVTSVVKLSETEGVAALRADDVPTAADTVNAAGVGLEWRLTLSPALRSAAPAEPMRPASSRSYRLEISNAMGMRGAARRVNALLMREGAPAAWLNDQRPFNQQQTRVLYARGYGEEADQLARRIGAEAVSANEVWGQRAVHLRIVLGKDVKPLIASLPEGDPPPVLAGWAPPELSSVRSPGWLARLAD